MADTPAILGYGTTFGIALNLAQPTNFTLIGHLLDVPMPEEEDDDVETTNQDSDDERKEYIPGLTDGGDLELELVYTPEAVELIESARKLKRPMRVTYPDGARDDFKGYIKKRGGSAPVQDKMTANCTIKICSKVVFTPPA